MEYSVIIPCYKSTEAIEELADLLYDFFSKNTDAYELILVNDGSPDNGETTRHISRIVDKYSNAKGIVLAKNTGQHNAIVCSLNYASGEYIIAMDDDMQTHPSQLPKLINEINKGYDVVYAYYPQKKHGLLRNIGSRFSSWSVRKLIGKPKEMRTSSYWIIKRFVAESIAQYRNSFAFIPGLILRTTNSISCIPVEHYERKGGKSGYTLKALVKLWSNIIGYSIEPLRLAERVGFSFSFLGVCGAFYLVVKKIVFGINVLGWTSIMVAICFFSGVLLFFMGLIGEYVGRMFLAINNQPQYVIREIIERK